MIQREEDVIHPEGCMCDDCKIERGEFTEEDAPEYPERPQQQRPAPPAPPPEPPPVRQPRKKRAPTNGGQPPPKYPESYTQPVRPPTHHHAQYIYEWGEMRRCHLCQPYADQIMHHDVDNPVWFASLEDRARHILEVHTDVSNPIIKNERSRAKEILGIKDLWDRHSIGQSVEFAKPIPYEGEEQEKKPLLQGLLGGQKKRKPMGYKKPNWFMEHKIISIILVLGVIYGVYVLYLMSQGYEF